MAPPKARPKDTPASPSQYSWLRRTCYKVVETKLFGGFVMGVIVANAIVLGLETMPYFRQHATAVLNWVNLICVGIYVAEAIAKLIAYRASYFKSGWNIFDFIITVSSVIPTGGVFSGMRVIRILRLLRTLRALRLISGIGQLRRIISALGRAIPGVGWTALLMVIMFYVAALIGIDLFGQDFPERFGGLGAAFSSLFELTTMEGWQDLVHPITAVYPSAWIYFLLFMVLASYILLNIVVGIVVDAIGGVARNGEAEEPDETGQSDTGSQLGGARAAEVHGNQPDDIVQRLAAIRAELDEIAELLEPAAEAVRQSPPPPRTRPESDPDHTL
ncbi:MAG: ion transporter [Bifidobacteriaceae bacterium]|nr:ion transporter [Bifidobacteriaceae bacterium]